MLTDPSRCVRTVKIHALALWIAAASRWWPRTTRVCCLEREEQDPLLPPDAGDIWDQLIGENPAPGAPVLEQIS